MIVRLTHHQARSVQRRVSSLHRQAMLDHRTTYGRTQHEYDLPAIAWEQILEELTETCFGPLGGKLDRGVPKSAYAAIRRISEATMRMERHPALRESGVMGWVGDVIPAWRMPDRWSHLPATGCRFEVLVPSHIVSHGNELTVWTPSDPPPPMLASSWTLTEAAHLDFIGRTASPDGELLADELELEDLVGRHPFGVDADG